MVLALLAAGHHITAVGRTSATLEELRAAARDAGTHERLLALSGDVTSPEDCAAVVARTIERFGVLDVLVNNAGMNRPNRERLVRPNFWDVSTDDWRKIVDTNVDGPFFMARAVVPH